MSAHHHPFDTNHCTPGGDAMPLRARVHSIPVCACGQDLVGGGSTCTRCGVTVRRVGHRNAG